MELMNVLIITERLKLKPISYDYTDYIFNEFTQDITKYMFPKYAENKEETIKFIENSLEELKKWNKSSNGNY